MNLERFMGSLSDVPYDADLTSGTLEFASKTTEDSTPGSLYFRSGRIRLHHRKGPKISKHEGIHRYPLSEEDFKNVKNSNEYRQRKWNAIEDRLKNDGNPHSITLNKGKRFIEFFEDKDGKTKLHRSRGKMIKAPPLNQVQINLIAGVVDLFSNTEMRNEMKKKMMKKVYLYAISHLK